MKRTIQSILIGVIAILTNVACVSQTESDIIEIRYGSQFGMCEGYCYSEEIYTIKSEKSISKAWGDTILNPTIVDTKGISKAKWSTLINSIDLNDFYSLKTTIGCPDCTDGGASWVEIKTSLKSYKVNYEYGNIPDPLNKLIEEIKN